MNVIKKEYHVMTKKIWVAPAVEELAIDGTLSGSNPAQAERFNANPNAQQFGSLPRGK